MEEIIALGTNISGMEPAITTCKNYGNHFEGNYCNQCGEKVYSEKDKSVFHFFEEGLHFITHFEGTFLNTLKKLFTQPGQLSFDYCNGKRKTYFKPLSFFLSLVVLYLLFPVFEGLNMKLYYHTHHNLYGKYAITGIIAYALLCVYVGAGARRFYNIIKWQSTGFAILFYIAHLIIVQYIYKFILFFIVIHQIQ